MRNKFPLLLAGLFLFAFLQEGFSQKKTGTTGQGQKKTTPAAQQKTKPPVKFTKEQIESFRDQSSQLVRFFEGTLNFLADKRNPVKEKEVIVNQSYKKTFRDEKVQVEDDLDDKRLVPVYKDIPAYLKDVDFFFKSAKFTYTVQDVSVMENDLGQTYFKVTANRNLKGVTVNGDSVNSNKVRYFEINYDDSKQQLMIVSIYTTKLNEKDDMKNWWNGLTDDWKQIFGKDQMVDGTLALSSLAAFQDSVALVNGVKVPVDGGRVYSLLTGIVTRKDIDISGNKAVTDITPLGKLSDLREVNLSGTGVSDLMPLRNLNDLESLDISGTPVDSLEALRYSSKIRVLKFNHTKVPSLELLTLFPGMEVLDFSYTPVSSAGPLKDLTEIQDLRLAGTAVSDLTPIAGLDKIQFLDFSGTPVMNAEALAGLVHLQIVFLNDTKVSTLKPFEQLPELKKIYCDNTQIGRDKALVFMQAHTGITVIFESEALLQWWNSLTPDWKKVFAGYATLNNPPTVEQLHRLPNLDSISISGRAGITSLSPLTKLPSLRYLDLSSTSVTGFEPLKDLTGLEVILAPNTKVGSLAPLAGLKNLKLLNVDNTTVSDLAPLDHLKNLTLVYADNTGVTLDGANAFFDTHPQVMVIFETYENTNWWKGLPDAWKSEFLKQTGLTGTPDKVQLQQIANLEKMVISEDPQITSLDPAVKLSRLKELEVSDTRITLLNPVVKMARLQALQFPKNPVNDLTPLAQMNNLREIDLSNTQVETLEPIQNLVNLEVLKFSGTPVKNLKYIEKLVNLKVVEFYNTKVSSLDILNNMRGLKSLKIFNTKVSAKKVDQFKAAHPGCEVVFY
ncbi:MAG TPA: hypothetical protein VMC08_00925 [Bacteroidales bacterium]|nr:hypothetical protein [Bacteroidales bacterium]